MKIGIDFDNTLAGYDHVFTTLAQEWDLVASSEKNNKRTIRERLVTRGDSGRRDWMRLQGQVYGRYMKAAELLPGARTFLAACKQSGHQIYIISHKTEYGHFDETRTHLHQAALQWMELQGFFSENQFSIPREQIFFLPTRDEKVAKIRALQLDLFIDDLEVVLSHPDFPTQTQPIHYLPDKKTNQTDHRWPICHNWFEITTHLFTQQSSVSELSVQVVQQLINRPILSLDKLAGGKNSNAYCANIDHNEKQLLKHYYNYRGDATERLQHESSALQFLHQQGETATPSLISTSSEHKLLLTQYIEGTTVSEHTISDIEQLCDFIERLKHYSSSKSAQLLPEAKEACLNNNTLIQQIEQRLQRLQAVSCIAPKLEQFINQHLRPAFNAVINSIYPFTLERLQQTLSPSDFGLHNTIRRSSGELAFIDFEYFGWDDPVKLTADTLLHPGFQLTDTEQQLFRKRMVECFSPSDPDFEIRLDALLPLYALRWCTIILNEFLPEKWAQRQFSGATDGATIREQQLQKARQLLQTHFA